MAEGKLEADKTQSPAETPKPDLETELARWKALIAELSELASGGTAPPADQVQSATRLGFLALQAAARALAVDLKGCIDAKNTCCIFVTPDFDLATVGASFYEAESVITALLTRAKELLLRSDTPPAPDLNWIAPPPILSAVAAALPGILSLFSSTRSLSFAALDKNDTAAAAAVIGALRKARPGKNGAAPIFMHAQFRIPERGSILQKFDALMQARSELVTKRRERRGTDPEPPAETKPEAAEILEIDATVLAIDALDAILRATPPGATRSAFASAILYETLFQSKPPPDYILLVKSEGGQVQQTTEDFVAGWRRDKVSILAEAAITYMMLELATSAIVAAGNVSGTAQAYGNVGERLRIDDCDRRGSSWG